MTTSQSASPVLQDEVKRGSHFSEPKAPLTCGGEAPARGPELFTFTAKNLLARGAAALALVLTGAVYAAPSAPVQAEVRKIDAAAGKITLKHGAIPELELPAMTLVYVVQDPGQLANIKPGDKVWFSADKINGQYTAVSIGK